MSPSSPDVDQLLHVPDGRIVEEGVTDHRDEFLFLSQAADLVDLGNRCGDRLFHQDVLSRFQGLHGQVEMRFDGGGDNNGLDFRVFQRLANIRRDVDRRIKTANVFLPLAGQLDNRFHPASLARDHIPQQIRAPVSDPDLRHVQHAAISFFVFSFTDPDCRASDR